MSSLQTITAESEALSAEIVATLTARSLKITFAESCTAGLLAGTFCSASGASAVFDGSVVSYANSVKESFLSVPPSILSTVGAVSEQCALAMASGVRARFSSDIALSVTGIAGPSGGTPSKPVGTVFIGVSTAARTRAALFHFPGDRAEVRARSVNQALKLCLEELHLLWREGFSPSTSPSPFREKGLDPQKL